MAIHTVTNENFEEEVTRAALPVLVDFWAPWCGYCRRIGPAVDQLGTELEGKVVVSKANIDEQPQLAERFEVETIPTLLLFRGGRPGQPLIAPAAKAQILDWIRTAGVEL